MPLSREANLKIFGHRYEKKGHIGDPCTYCGEPSDTMDHIPPLCFADSRSDIGQSFIVVPSCSECNTHLGGRLFLTITHRRKSVREYLRRKYAKALRMPEWDDDELAELSAIWAQNFKAASNLAHIVRRRIFATLGHTDQRDFDAVSSDATPPSGGALRGDSA